MPPLQAGVLLNSSTGNHASNKSLGLPSTNIYMLPRSAIRSYSIGPIATSKM